jgi:hypothetical protein
MPGPQPVKQNFAGIDRVEILNRRENVRFQSADPANGIAVDGLLADPVLGLSQSSTTLYLIAFEGTVSLPDSTVIHYKRGIDDLQKELVDTYAPSLSYGKILETRDLARSLVGFRDVPTADVLPLIHRFSNATTRKFFSPQEELSAPPNLERIERTIRAEKFRWDGPYSFVSKIQAQNYSVIPELAGARTTDELWTKVLEFINVALYAKGASLTAMVRELNRVSLLEPQALLSFLLEIQPAIAQTEAHGQVLATTAMQSAEDKLHEGLEELHKKSIPFGATIAQLFADVAAPISHDHWAAIMAETAAREAGVRGKGQPTAPGSKKVVQAHIGMRDASNWEKALNDKKAFSMTLVGEAIDTLRLRAHTYESAYQTATQQDLRSWLSEATSAKTSALNWFNIRRNERQEFEFTPEKKGNIWTIHTVGAGADEQFQGAASSSSPSPSPSPSPSVEPPSKPPAKSTSKSFGEYLGDLWDWGVSHLPGGH